MKHSGQTILWELWAALCLCTALVLPPGSPCKFLFNVTLYIIL